MKTLNGEFALTNDPPNPPPNPSIGDDDGKVIWISWGDYMTWHLDVVRDGIIKLYGKESVTEIERGRNGVYHFGYDEGVDFKRVGKLIGVVHSGPSRSSCSTTRKGKRTCQHTRRHARTA